ncbi:MULTISPECIES: MerR family transcriptional regulator [Deinococcus]|uniref:MerR family transcriptional regulator n=1 Tax=Deinococcus rufus TaxID=2136097 RepID=A0ABV7Z633_9DEIO|nr:MerR family transcriptional regulator [Deinococcus sp. AB2017081]WQE96195.1 MerR family transcriptional regulator [Deinococcus sp. AB2017081]
MTDGAVGLTIGEVARQTGLSVHTLRLYEREGLLTGAVTRDAAGRRIYRDWDVEWLLNCTKFRASGMPLATIRRLAGLVGEGSGNEAERLALLREHQQAVLARMADLQACLELISHKVEVYEAHVAQGTVGGVWSPAPARS